jgi:hypothetical protein
MTSKLEWVRWRALWLRGSSWVSSHTLPAVMQPFLLFEPFNPPEYIIYASLTSLSGQPGLHPNIDP